MAPDLVNVSSLTDLRHTGESPAGHKRRFCQLGTAQFHFACTYCTHILRVRLLWAVL